MAWLRAIPLARRFAWTTAARLALLTLLLGVIAVVNVSGDLTSATYTHRVALWTLGIAFAMSGVYAWFLRQGRHLRALVTLQLVLDQGIWTVVVYLSGGASSGATSFYGISCLLGAVLAGFRGAAIAATCAGVCYIALVFSLARGYLAAPPDQPLAAYSASSEELLYSTVVNVLALVVVALLAGNLSERLRATGGELLRAEQRAAQAEREAELGRLAAGLAHEIRNPLGSIAGSIRLLEVNASLDEEERSLCSIIQHESERLNELVSDMLNLSKPKSPELMILDPTRIAEDVVRLAQNSGRGRSDVDVQLGAAQDLAVRADGGMLRQLLWNLVRNAVQASGAGGVVQLRLTQAGERVVVSVIDRGDGLSDDAKARIFDPFYTTRSQGTGIGLAVVKRIADDHGWRIDVLDTPGGGATFQVGIHVVPQVEGKEEPKSLKHWTLFPKAP